MGQVLLLPPLRSLLAAPYPPPLAAPFAPESHTTKHQGLIETLVSLCFNEIASFVHGCQHYLRQRQEIEGASVMGSNNASAAGQLPHVIGGGGDGHTRLQSGVGGGSRAGAGRSASMMSVGDVSVALGIGGRRRREADPRFTEVKICLVLFCALMFLFFLL